MVDIPCSPSGPRRRVAIGALVLALLAGCSAAGQSGSSEFVTFTLKGGEAREIVATPFYRSMRVCNHTDSPGPITATIDNNIQHELAPGVCVRDAGGHGPHATRTDGTYDTSYPTTPSDPARITL